MNRAQTVKLWEAERERHKGESEVIFKVADLAVAIAKTGGIDYKDCFFVLEANGKSRLLVSLVEL